MAAAHAFGVPTNSVPELFPYGIYAIPEISTVGQSEEELTAAGVPYEVGKANYREIARGQIIGDRTGFLKVIFHLESYEILGVHIIGEGASKLIHIGQAVMVFKGKSNTSSILYSIIPHSQNAIKQQLLTESTDWADTPHERASADVTRR